MRYRKAPELWRAQLRQPRHLKIQARSASKCIATLAKMHSLARRVRMLGYFLRRRSKPIGDRHACKGQ